MLTPVERWPVEPGSVQRVGVFPGTFDPVTVGHVALAEAAAADGCELVVVCVPHRSVGKEDRGLHRERLATVVEVFSGRDGFAVATTTTGLYVDLAEAAAAVFTSAQVDLVCGADKVHQILDPAFYDEPLHGVLERLFSRARLLAAPRAGMDVPEHPGIRVIGLDESVHHVSASDVRRRHGAGEDVGHLLAGP